jgi:Ras-related protein Rab-7A
LSQLDHNSHSFEAADAAVLMFNVNEPDALEALTKWWDEFRESTFAG